MKRRPSDGLSEVTIYAFSHCETWIEDYAKSHNLPAHELTQRVATLLLAQTSGKELGAIYSMPPKPRPQASQRSNALAEVAVVSRPRSKVQGVRKFTGVRDYKGKHWTQNPKNRAKLLGIIKARHGRAA